MSLIAVNGFYVHTKGFSQDLLVFGLNSVFSTLVKDGICSSAAASAFFSPRNTSSTWIT